MYQIEYIQTPRKRLVVNFDQLPWNIRLPIRDMAQRWSPKDQLFTPIPIGTHLEMVDDDSAQPLLTIEKVELLLLSIIRALLTKYISTTTGAI